MLILGKGHLGTFLSKRFNAPILSKDILEYTANDFKGHQFIINTIGKTDLPFCEANPQEAFRVNAQGPLHLFREITKFEDLYLFQISSGCVWDGPYDAEGNPFRPSSVESPACWYSWTKVAGDSMIRREMFRTSCSRVAILRPRQLYSGIKSQRNTLQKLMKYEALLDTPNSMTSSETIAKTIEKIIANNDNESTRYVSGEILVYDKGITSPYEVGMMLHEAGLRSMPKKLTKADLDTWHKPKRVDTVLCDEYFERLVNPPNIKEELRRNIALLKDDNA